MKHDTATACFTGRRKINDPDVEARLDVVIDRCIEKGYRRFICGGALGFDTIAAKRVAAARERRPDVSLVLILPCRDQTKMWNSLPDINEYRHIKDIADEIKYVQIFYDDGCMMKRNMMMVNESSLCIAYFNGRAGGTAKTVRYAEEKGVPVVNLYIERKEVVD